MALPSVAPVSGRSGADVGATLADLTAPVVVSAPSVVAEQSQAQPDAATVVLEGAVQSVPPEAQVDPPMTLEATQVEEGPVGGSSSVAVVPHRVRREPPPAPLSGGSRSPARGEPPLQWMAAQDPTSALFSLDDHSESMEREGLDIGISTMLNALD